MTKIKRYIWQLAQNIYFFKDIGLSFYHFLKKNRRCIQGHGNIIDIQSDQNLPHLQNVLFDIAGNNNEIIIKSGVILRDFKFHIRGNKHKILIDENVIIKGGSFWFNDEEGQIYVGKRTTIQQAKIGIAESKTSVNLGEDCMLAHGIEIITGDSHSIIDFSMNQRINYPQSIKIENHVWIAKHVQVLKGVSIGCHSIIGTGSIVTKDIPEYSLAVGVPAKVAKTGVTWVREKI